MTLEWKIPTWIHCEASQVVKVNNADLEIQRRWFSSRKVSSPKLVGVLNSNDFHVFVGTSCSNNALLKQREKHTIPMTINRAWSWRLGITARKLDESASIMAPLGKLLVNLEKLAERILRVVRIWRIVDLMTVNSTLSPSCLFFFFTLRTLDSSWRQIYSRAVS